MRIKSCTDFINEGVSDWFKRKSKVDPNDIDGNGIPDFLYHAVEPDAINSIMANGLIGNIYLTLLEIIYQLHSLEVKLYQPGC